MPSPLAERIAEAHNAMRAAVLEHGTLVFSPGAEAVEPIASQDASVDLDRIPFPVADHQVTVDEVESFLAEYRAWQAEAIEQRDRARLEARARQSIRVGQRERDYGHRTGAFPCPSCGRFKSKPSAVCSQCGDDPVAGGMPSDQDRRDFDRAHGYAA